MKFNILWKKEDSIALALSTGVDSIVLLDLLLSKYRDTYKELVIFHVNHGFRPQSQEEAIFAQSLAEKNGLRFFKKDLNLNDVTNNQHISQEMLAREARYSAFYEFSSQSGVNLVLTGHHQNDNLENIFMRILMARAINHRIDIEEKLDRGQISLLRPMLEIRKSQIEEYAKLKNLDYRQDESNFDTRYTRNYVRKEIIPHLKNINAGAETNVLEFAQHYKEMQDYIQASFEERLARLDIKKEQDKISIAFEDYEKFSDLEKELYITTILNKELDIYMVTRSAIKSAIKQIDKTNRNISLDLKENIKIIKEYQSIRIVKFEKKCYNDKIIINSISSQEEIYSFAGSQILISENNLDADYGFNKEDLPLTFRLKKDGDRIQRGNISKKVSRLFIDYKLAKEDRERVPILEKEGRILAVLGLTKKLNKEKKYDYYIKILKG
ncbi:tRNA lysidine(34) synthetase TilS [Gemella sp. 19428wG2_WT2a]|nr:tRNA lysidine(34) synthetase TilS [Gemella sp. 19428wG2_WT2a]TFU58178.1 tRNA lysidine(34) synthetase TilS [Gemella sp. WT2a]